MFHQKHSQKEHPFPTVLQVLFTQLILFPKPVGGEQSAYFLDIVCTSHCWSSGRKWKWHGSHAKGSQSRKLVRHSFPTIRYSVLPHSAHQHPLPFHIYCEMALLRPVRSGYWQGRQHLERSRLLASKVASNQK